MVTKVTARETVTSHNCTKQNAALKLHPDIFL